MAIQRYFLPDGRPTHFHVSEEIEVYDGTAALLLDHFFNHLKFFIGGCVILESDFELISQFPRYLDAYNNDTLQEIIAKDCKSLLELVLKSGSLPSEETLNAINQVKKSIPFIDYHYPNDSSAPLDPEGS